MFKSSTVHSLVTTTPCFMFKLSLTLFMEKFQAVNQLFTTVCGQIKLVMKSTVCIITHFEKTTVFRAFLGRASLANTMPAMQAWSTNRQNLTKNLTSSDIKLNNIETTPLARCPTGPDIFFEITHQRGQWIHKVDVFCCQESLNSKWSAVSLSRNHIFKKITLTKICTERSTIFISCLSLFGDSGTLQKASCGMSGVFSGVKFNSKQLLFSSLYPKSA